MIAWFTYYELVIINLKVEIRPLTWLGLFYNVEAKAEGRIFRTQQEAERVAIQIRPHLDKIKQILKENK